MSARPPEARVAAAAATGLGLVLLVIVVSVAIRLEAGPLAALRGVHRASASLEVLAMLALAWLAWRRAFLVIALTVFLSLLGIFAGQNPPPAAALGNLLGGLALAAAFAWVLGRAHGRAPQNQQRLGHAVAALFVLQCALGAWLAILAEELWSLALLAHALIGLTLAAGAAWLALFAGELWSWALAAHATLGLALAAGAAWLALRLEHAGRRFALLGAALAAPAAGAASALLGQPVAAALAHAAAAALLVAAAAYAHARLA